MILKSLVSSTTAGGVREEKYAEFSGIFIETGRSNMLEREANIDCKLVFSSEMELICYLSVLLSVLLYLQRRREYSREHYMIRSTQDFSRFFLANEGELHQKENK